MTRLAVVPTGTGIIEEAEQQLDDIKRSQWVGASSLDTTWNLTGFGTMTLAASASGVYNVTFTATKQDNAFVLFDYEIFTGGTDPSNKDLTVFAEIYRGYSADPKVANWKFVLFNHYSTTKTFYIRLYYISTDTGILSAT